MKERSTSRPRAGSGKVGEPTRSIHWDEVHRRLDSIRAALEGGVVLTREQEKATLRARARSLAREPVKQKTPAACFEAVEFLLAQERYGIESSYVVEVYPLKDLTPLPCTPPFVLGIVNVRGRILSVIDLKKFFELPEKGLTDLNKVIVVRADEMIVGILADAVVGVREVPLSDVQPSLPTLTGIRAEYLKGVTSERLVLLDAGKILSDEKIVVHEQVEGA